MLLKVCFYISKNSPIDKSGEAFKFRLIAKQLWAANRRPNITQTPHIVLEWQ